MTCPGLVLRLPSERRLYLIRGRKSLSTKYPSGIIICGSFDHWRTHFQIGLFECEVPGENSGKGIKTSYWGLVKGIIILGLFLSSFLPMFSFPSTSTTTSQRSPWIWSTDLGAEAGFEIFWRVLNMPELTGLPGPAAVSELPQTPRIVWQ